MLADDGSDGIGHLSSTCQKGEPSLASHLLGAVALQPRRVLEEVGRAQHDCARHDDVNLVAQLQQQKRKARFKCILDRVSNAFPTHLKRVAGKAFESISDRLRNAPEMCLWQCVLNPFEIRL